MTEAISIAERYHEETKYSPEGIATKQHQLDWEKKPLPWKDYESERIPLFPHLGLTGPTLEKALAALPLPALPRELGLGHLARLLFFANGVTRVEPQPGALPQLYRAAPSAGALYPTEIYVVANEGAIQGLPGGVWNLDVRDLSVARVTREKDAFSKLASTTAAEKQLARARAALVLTGVFYRSSWRYEERAYRRILLDTGHVLGNVVIAAARLGLVALPVGGFDDNAVELALELDPTDEGGLVVVPLFAKEDLEVRPPRGALALKGPVVPAEACSREDGVMKALHQATRLRAPLSRAAGRDAPGDAYQESVRQGTVLPLPHATLELGQAADRTILVRRSTRAFSGEPFTKEELSRLLHFAYLGSATGEDDARLLPGTIDSSLLETWIAWNRAEDAEPGIYYYRSRSHELVLTRPGERSRECYAVCLGQELGRDAACVVFHTVDLPRAVARYGDRAYRYIHLDAGHLGERLNLAAIHMGLGASGIGGFFDDRANALLGLPPRSVIVYPTCLGRSASR